MKQILELSMVHLGVAIPILIIAKMLLGIAISDFKKTYEKEILIRSIKKYLAILASIALTSIALLIAQDTVEEVLQVELPFIHGITIYMSYFVFTLVKDIASKIKELSGFKSSEETENE